MGDVRKDVEALPVVGYLNGLHDGTTCLHQTPTKHFGGTVLWETPLVRQSDALAALAEAEQRAARFEAIATGVRSYLVDALAMELAEQDGHEGDAKHKLIWSGGAVKEPECEVWQRYEPQARKLADAALSSVADWSAAEDDLVRGLHEQCIADRIAAEQRAEAAEADARRYRWLESRAIKHTGYDVYGNGCHWSAGFVADDSNLSFREAVDAKLSKEASRG